MHIGYEYFSAYKYPSFRAVDTYEQTEIDGSLMPYMKECLH
jgi:hypothetical protein